MAPALPWVVRLGNIGVRLGLALLRDRVVVEGAEHVPDQPAVIVASNHLSILDPPLLTVAVASLVGRQVRYMAKAEAFDMPLVGPILRAYGGFGVQRDRPDREAYRVAQDVLASGAWLGLAPEGTRSRTGHLGEPKAGVALLAIRSGATVLPVGISGSDQAWPVGARVPRPGTRVMIRFGPAYRLPAQAEPYAGPPSTTDRRPVLQGESEALMRRIAQLLPPSYRGRFG
jgi:1-acyl-sn-glycerol-3-phosphate acyltransferase